jgi:hypothetical protein
MAKIAYKPRFLTISSTSALNTPWLRPVFSRAKQHVLYSVYFESTRMSTVTIGKGWPEWMRPLVENEVGLSRRIPTVPIIHHFIKESHKNILFQGSRQFLVALEEFKQKKVSISLGRGGNVFPRIQIGAKPDLHFFHDGGVEALKEEIAQLAGSDWEDLACFVVVDAFPNPRLTAFSTVIFPNCGIFGFRPYFREILLFLALWFSALFLSIPIQKGLSRMRRRKAL